MAVIDRNSKKGGWPGSCFSFSWLLAQAVARVVHRLPWRIVRRTASTPSIPRCLIAGIFLILFSSSLNAEGEQVKETTKSDLMMGKRIYSVSCILCHGSKGQGDGPASVFIGPYSHPRPNDFTRGSFKFRTTESSELPTLSDLMATIRYGIPGFMPSFRHLGEEGIRQVALYIATKFIREELPAQTTTVSDRRGEIFENERSDILNRIRTEPGTQEAVSRGMKAFAEMKCIECHGTGGKGAITNMKDERGLDIKAADLTKPETFGNGNSPEDIYRTIMTGLTGTPMPSYGDLFKGKEMLAWDIVAYILSLQDE